MAEHPIPSDVHGIVFKIDLAPGAPVAAGQRIMALESMKMEIPVEAPRAGTIAKICVAEGDIVAEAQTLVIIET